MKKFLAIFLALLICVPLLASCNLDLSEKFNQLSDQLFSQIVDLAGGFIKEDTTPKETFDYSSELIKDSSTEDIESTPVETEPENPDGPENPDEPELPDVPKLPELVAYTRTKSAVHKFIGLNVTSSYHKEGGAYGFARLYRAYDKIIDDSEGYAYFRLYGIDPLLFIDLNLSAVKAEPEENQLSYTDVAGRLYEFAKNYCSAGSSFNLGRIEIGSNPDLTMSAEEYAALVNYIYDGNQSELGDGYGIARINPNVKLMTGSLSTLDLDYIKALMTAISGLRNDGFLPIGGWSFNYQKGGAPESAYLNDPALLELIEYRDTYYSNMEIIISSFGWDTVDTESPYYAPQYFGVYSSEEIQAAYIMRAYMIFDMLGVDRATLVALKDTEDNGCGLVKENGAKKVSFNTLTTFKSLMKNMYFEEACENGENGVYCYKYKNASGKEVYALWSTSKTDYTLSIEGAVTVSTYNNGAYTSETVDTLGTLSLYQMPVFVTK